MARSAHYATTADRERNIAVITGLVQKWFVKKDVAAFGSAHALMVELENSLRRARYEASRYEFKLGLCELTSKPSLDSGMFAKLARTACAIANSNPGNDGYIYLGVADKESAAERVETLFGILPLKIGDVYFVGLGHDLSILKIDIETYVKNIIIEISKLPISDPLKTQITTTIDHAEYQGRPFVRIRVPGQGELSSYDRTYPVRKNSETIDLGPTEAVAQAKLFK
jgi:predicted HTH transcriptional regulator